MLLGLVLPADPVHAKATPTTKATTAAKATTPPKATPAKAATPTKAPTKAPTTVKAAATVTKTTAPTGKTTTLAETTPTLAGRLAVVKIAKSINYYPAGAGWSKMWSSWDAAKVDADLAKAAALGATNVRAIIFPNTFGFPTPQAEYTSRLASFVSMAGARGMTVRFTLFDWWDGYSEVTNSVNWATTLLTPYRNDSRVISVELQNEFNPSDTAAVAWAKKIVPAVRSAFPTMPLTFSVDGTTGIPGMSKIKSVLGSTPVDFYDYHFYGNSERALAMVKQAQAAVAPAPVVIGEVGLNTLQNTEGEQAAFLARVFQAATQAGVLSVSPWTLTDFAQGAIPDSQVAKLPAQYSYGLYRTDGSAKPAAAVVKAAWMAAAMPADLLDNGFEAAAGQTAWRPFLPELGLGVKTQAQARSGKWSLSFTNTGKNASGVPSWRVAPITPVQPNQKWHAEVYARGNAASGTNQIALSWFDANDKWLGGASSASLPAGTTNWTKLAVDGTAPAGAASMQVHLKSGENDGTIWFDDVLVTAA
ncbi:cellulase family glycosylhydrolase [Actinoplanes sp. TBRC 11911]|nr:cellulase family glycosylhydrolase [Actinoplanes sp. TBRC 11911]